MPRTVAVARPLAFIAALALAPPAHATPGAATGLPWEGAIQTIANSITGPIAGAFALLALAGAGYKWYQGSSHGEGASNLVKAIFAISLVTLGGSVLGTLGLLGAVVN